MKNNYILSKQNKFSEKNGSHLKVWLYRSQLDAHICCYIQSVVIPHVLELLERMSRNNANNVLLS